MRNFYFLLPTVAFPQTSTLLICLFADKKQKERKEKVTAQGYMTSLKIVEVEMTKLNIMEKYHVLW